ncbi:hypothetical protein BDY19DRAFT_1055563 [Irpex rosettiformis]|uniref:Uncharacterized protein n=1 Tax=Irpex rosettiformis TaxID=378272 RepID=A0ACB8U8D4_9APHY|nr:hypothetical protein BDY19DRAFT_1055563 [Irpex rosettiformis]
MSSLTAAANTTTTAPSSSNSGGGAGFFSIFGLILGIIGLAGLFQIGYNFIESYLPSTRLKALDAASHETFDLFKSMLEDGLFSSSDQVKSMEHRLSNLRRDGDRLRPKVHIAITFKQQLLGWWHGISKQINDTLQEIHATRAEISVICAEERRKQERENLRLRPRLLHGGSHATSRAMHTPPLARNLALGIPSANHSITRATGITGLHASQSSLTTRAPVYSSDTSRPGHQLFSLPPPAFIPPSVPGAVATKSEPDPHERLRGVTDQLSQATGRHGLSEMPVLPAEIVDDGKVHPSEIERTMNVLNDLAKRLSVIAAQELTKSQNGQVSSTAGQADSAQLSKLIDGLKAVHAAATQSSTQSNADVPSTATIVELDDPPQVQEQIQGAPSPLPVPEDIRT